MAEDGHTDLRVRATAFVQQAVGAGHGNLSEAMRSATTRGTARAGGWGAPAPASAALAPAQGRSRATTRVSSAAGTWFGAKLQPAPNCASNAGQAAAMPAGVGLVPVVTQFISADSSVG